MKRAPQCHAPAGKALELAFARSCHPPVATRWHGVSPPGPLGHEAGGQARFPPRVEAPRGADTCPRHPAPCRATGGPQVFAQPAAARGLSPPESLRRVCGRGGRCAAGACADASCCGARVPWAIDRARWPPRARQRGPQRSPRATRQPTDVATAAAPPGCGGSWAGCGGRAGARRWPPGRSCGSPAASHRVRSAPDFCWAGHRARAPRRAGASLAAGL